MALTLGDNFSYQGAKPLDARLKYDTLANMKAVADATMYDGCMAYCVATDKTYQWKSTNTVDADTGRWREFSSGGGGGTSDYPDLTNKPSINNVTLSGNKTSSDLGLAPADVANTCYKTGDTAFTALADADYVPVYDTSASAKKKSTWSNIKSVLKTYFDTLYNKVTAGTGLSLTNNAMSIKAFESGDMEEVMSPLPSSAPRYNVYSTEEQVVGQWIDGSTIYEKTYEVTMPTVTTDGTTITSKYEIGTTIEKCISCESWFNKNGTIVFLNDLTSTSRFARIAVITNSHATSSERNKINVTSASTIWSGITGYVTIRYTKTT